MLVVALLAATAAAFALTQGLKSELSPIYGTDVAEVFSPVCGCDTRTASIAFKLREGDSLDVSIVDGGEVIRTIERSREYSRGPVEVEWDGRDDEGRLVPEGEYLPRVRLREDRRTITLPNPIRIDVTPPRIRDVGFSPAVFSPDGDRRADRVTFDYRVSEPAKLRVYVGERRRIRALFARSEDAITWNGRSAGRSLPAGTYPVRLEFEDPAGNVASQVLRRPLVVRYVALGRNRITVAAGSRFALRVSSDARTVRWRLGGRSGVVRPGTLRIRAPLQKGQFTLTVTANGHTARAAVFVREQPR